MSTQSLPDGPAEVKPEPPLHPELAMLRTLEQSCAERDRLAAARLAALSRTLEGRERSCAPCADRDSRTPLPRR